MQIQDKLGKPRRTNWQQRMTMGKNMARLIVTALITTLGLSLSACSPRFDWREIPNTEAGYVALFPARPAQFTRPLPYPGQNIALTLQAVVIDDINFAIGYARLPHPAANDTIASATTAQWIAHFEAALLDNLQAQITQTHATTAPLMRDITAIGTLRTRREDPQGRPATLRARFYIHNHQLYEVMVIAPTTTWNSEAADTFLTGFQLRSTQKNP